ncbi:GGDEF domain-containing protein [Cupriavidus necator]|uniref:diguanylate cyclase domain-containing protein n=1 Tax=Cupriavidus necator TaxID=106590 RepID=UPI0039C3CD04
MSRSGRWHGLPLWGGNARQPEREQAVLRVSLAPIVLLAYLAVALLQSTPAAYATSSVLALYLAYGVATYVAVRRKPSPSRIRLGITTVIDQACVILALAVGGRVSLPLLWVMFWFLVGASCRYGIRMLFLSCAVTLGGLAGLLYWSPWWQANPEAGMGLVLSVVATSVYLAMLVHRLERQAATDPLTGLNNRLRLEEVIAQSQAGTPRHEAGQSALLLIDLDGFKEVNDTYGHAVGDALLQRFAKALQARMRRGDTLARLGGDEFLVLARHIHAKADARAIADSIHTILSGFHAIDEYPVTVSASIGVRMLVSGPLEGPLDISVLLRQADSAMYRAKARGKGQTVFADEADFAPNGVSDRHSARRKIHQPLDNVLAA